MRARGIVVALGMGLIASRAYAGFLDRFDTSVGTSKIETNDLELIYYDPAETYLTPYVARAFENSQHAQEARFDWTPWEKKTVIYLLDVLDYGNAAARSVPNDGVDINIAPFATTFETFTPGERFYTILNHELVHVATLDDWNTKDSWWRNFLHGKPYWTGDHPESLIFNYLATPRANAPRWWREGSAVYLETWMSGGLGRAQGGYDEMVFRAMVRDNAKFFDPLGLESAGSKIDFQVGVNEYLYGERFFTYLAYAYSPEKVVEWLKRGNASYASYEDDFERVFGKPLDDGWADWIAFEHKFQAENLRALAQYPPTPEKKLTPQALGSVSKSYYDPKTNSLIGGYRVPGVLASISEISLNNGGIRHITDITAPALYRVTSLAYDPRTRTAWYTTKNNAMRDLMQLDVNSGTEKLLIRHARIGDIAFDSADHSLWGVRSLFGLMTLVRLKPPYTEANQIYTFDFGEIPTDIDISPDGQLLCASIAEINGDQAVNVYRIDDLMRGVVKPVASLRLQGSYPEGGTFSKDGRYLYATSYYTGISNVYRLDLATGKVDAVSNAVTGYFRPVGLDDGSLVVFEYTGQGFRPVRIDPKPINDLGTIKFLGTETVNKHPVLKSYAVGSPANIPIDQMITSRGEYIPQKEIKLDATYPVVQGYKGHVGLGWYANFEDPLQFNQLQLLVSASPAGDLRPWEFLHADVSYRTLYWRVRYWHNEANFYDLFGPVDRSRKGDALLGGYREVLIWDLPRELDFTADVGLYTGLDTLPTAQNVHGSVKQIAEAKLGLKYTNTAQSLGAVDYESGYAWDVEAQEDYARYDSLPKFHGGFDFGFPLPWKHSSLWLYSSTGIALGAVNNVLNDYYFGSFGNNYVDNGDVKRYRHYDSFPGFKIDEIGARSFVKSTLEWNLPPVRFEDIGTPAYYLGSIRTALFGGALWADPGSSAANEHVLADAGVQLDLNFTIDVNLPMTFSVGYAHGFGDSALHGREEILASLKIL
jgi:hypothetical protein